VATTTERVGAAAGPRALSGASLVVLALGGLDFGLEQSLIVPALPAFADHYDASVSAVGWLVTGFLLAGIVAVPVLGRLGDIFGKRRLLLVTLAAFAAGSLICALAGSIELVVAGRIVQGVGTAFAPLTYGLARDTMPAERVPRAIGLVVGASGAGSGIGFLLSGFLIDRASVAAIFWLLFAVAVALALATALAVPESPVRARVRVDLAGATLLGLGLAALLLAISKGADWGWLSGRTLALFAVAAVLLACFAAVERRVREPLVDLALVVRRPFAEANLCTAAFGFSFFVAVLLLPLIAGAPEDSGYGLGLSTTGIGLVLFPTAVAAMVGGWASGRIVARLGSRLTAAIGAAIGLAAYIGLIAAHGSAVELAAGSAAIGFAWGLIITSVYMVVVRSVGSDKTSVAIAVTILSRNTFAAVGTQAGFAIVAATAVAGALPTDAGFTRAYVMGAIGAGVTLILALALPGRRHQPSP
jgi:MFS family permease